MKTRTLVLKLHLHFQVVIMNCFNLTFLRNTSSKQRPHSQVIKVKSCFTLVSEMWLLKLQPHFQVINVNGLCFTLSAVGFTLVSRTTHDLATTGNKPNTGNCWVIHACYMSPNTKQRVAILWMLFFSQTVYKIYSFAFWIAMLTWIMWVSVQSVIINLDECSFKHRSLISVN